jgi:hypothetical protein
MVTCRCKQDSVVIFMEFYFLTTLKVLTLFIGCCIENIERTSWFSSKLFIIPKNI